jgi:hypothetical protein
MFYPQPENDDSEEFYSYSSAGPMKSVGVYAQDGAGQSLSMAYQMMYNRFSGFMGFGNRYNYYNPYYNYNGGYYNNSYTLAGYTMYVPLAKFPDKGTPRTWSRDGKSPTTNLTTTRTTTESSNNNNDSGQTNSSNVSSNRGSSSSTSISSSSSSSSKGSGGRRATRRN